MELTAILTPAVEGGYFLPSWSSAFPGGKAEFESRINDYMPSGMTFPLTTLFFMFSQIICTFFVLFRVS
jgi:hypothetical protein